MCPIFSNGLKHWNESLGGGGTILIPFQDIDKSSLEKVDGSILTTSDLPLNKDMTATFQAHGSLSSADLEEIK